MWNCDTTEKDHISEFNQHMKSDKMSYIIYVDMESLIKKTEGCSNNAENSSTTKIGEHTSKGYSKSKIWAFDHMKMFCESWRKHVKNIIAFEKKKR